MLAREYFFKKNYSLTYWEVQKKWSKKNGFQQHQPWSPDTLEDKNQHKVLENSVCHFHKGTFTFVSIALPQ